MNRTRLGLSSALLSVLPSLPVLSWGVAIVVSGSVGMGGSAAAADWPAFRGPDGSGVASQQAVCTKWSESENLLWRTELPGPGTSSPIVVGDLVLLTCYSGYGVDPEAPGNPEDLVRHVVAVRRDDGRIAWQQRVAPQQPAQAFEGFLKEHGFASSTPASDGQRLYCFFGRDGVYGFDLAGRQLWRADVGSGKNGWGSASSPVVYGRLVIVNAFVESRSLIALDGRTGQEVWRVEGLRRTWSTPLVARTADGQDELVVSMQGEIWGVDPATGERLWKCQGIDDYVCPSPVAAEGVAYVIGGRRGQAIAVRLGGRGDVDESHVLWRAAAGSNVPSPVLVDGHLYWVNHRGIAHCLDAETGQVVYRERARAPGGVYASMLAAGGHLFAVTRRDGTIVLPAVPTFEVVGQNAFSPDETLFNASPAVADGTLYLRSNQALYAVAEAR